MEVEIDEATKFEIVSQFLKDSPPGEINDVYNDVRTLLNDDSLADSEEGKQAFSAAFEEYNTEQLLTVQVPGESHEVIICKYSQLEDGRYVDPRSSSAFNFDHLNTEMYNLDKIELNSETEHCRALLDTAAQKYISEHYPDGVTSVFDIGNDSFAIAIVDNKYNPKNFWNGRWRSLYTVKLGSVDIVGTVKLQIHYYEDGNVQLNYNKEIKGKLLSPFTDPNAFASAVFKVIEKQENDIQLALHEAYEELSGTTFKNLRKPLPVTKTKIDWNFVAGYKIGAELASKISNSSIHQICSGQVILDLAGAIKELIENSLDANATNIEVRIKDSGLGGIEVIDNGTGIAPENFESVALKHYTSKIRTFEDLKSVSSFGFRGEALSSLCAVSALVVTTAREQDAPRGTRIEYDSEGKIKDKRESARGKGTTVSVSNFFAQWPVRYSELKRNIKKEYSKCLELIQSYALICDGVRISCVSVNGKNQRTPVLATNGNFTIKDNFANIFDSKLAHTLMPFSFKFLVDEVAEEEEDSEVTAMNTVKEVEVLGLISKAMHGNGRNSSDRQYVYINKRPVDMPKLIKLVNEVYKGLVSNQYPILIINLKLPTDSYDVNVTPNKRKIFIQQEKKIYEEIQSQFVKLFDTTNGITLKVNNDTLQSTSSFLSQNSGKESLSSSSRSSSFFNASSSDDPKNMSIVPSESAKLDIVFVDTQTQLSDVSEFTPKNTTRKVNFASFNPDRFSLKRTRDQVESTQIDKKAKAQQRLTSLWRNTDSPTPAKVSTVSDTDNTSPSRAKESNMVIVDLTAELAKKPSWMDFSRKPNSEKKRDENYSTHSLTSTVELDLTKIEKSCSRYAEQKRNSKRQSTIEKEFKEGINPDTNEAAERELDRFLSKDDFRKMYIIGQFNLGFIVAKLGQDLFVIDQHASDEKWNYELLNKTYKVQVQPLIRPLKLGLTSQQLLLAEQHEKILNMNGFQLQFTQSNALIGESTVARKQASLVGVPQLAGVSFGAQDCEELIQKMSIGNRENVRCDKLLAKFASKACRTSVMIGMTLDESQMRKIVDHMGEMNQPWNCPHGRPTTRHLVTLNS
ncbi:Mismatch repair endonuclease pms2 [Nowakowskiella sp. JEL0407]|nr:Mismatch repair endonuclease pms2 [Nowakowskiella sp. JEL0407]